MIPIIQMNLNHQYGEKRSVVNLPIGMHISLNDEVPMEFANTSFKFDETDSVEPQEGSEP